MKKSVLLAALAAAAAVPAAAATDPLYEQGFSMRLGGFYSSADTTLRIDATNGAVGTSISLEDDLGFSKEETLPFIDAIWRINPRHRVELGYVSLARDSQKTITGEIRFGDSVFPVNANVGAAFDSDVWRLTYGWSSTARAATRFPCCSACTRRRSRRSSKSSSANRTIVEVADRTIPLPTIGLSGTWAIDPQWRLSATAQIFALNYGDYEGSLFNGSLSGEYRFNRNWALGLGYTAYDYDLDVTSGNARGSFDYKFSGPMLYVTGGF